MSTLDAWGGKTARGVMPHTLKGAMSSPLRLEKAEATGIIAAIEESSQ